MNNSITNSYPRDSALSDKLSNQAVTNPSRRQFTRQRRQLSEQQRRLAATLASGQLYKLNGLLPQHARIAFYYDDFGELPTQPILDWCQRLGYLGYLPVVGSLDKSDKRMRFAPIYRHQLSALPTSQHALGMLHYQHRNLLWAHELDVIFCPLVAADLHGNRMGMGGGYYDTTLAKVIRTGRKRTLIIGWCYDFQVVEQLVRQPWDVPLDALITPTGIRWFK